MEEASTMVEDMAWAWVLYNDDADRLWHQRRVIGRVASSDDLVIVTPDLDLYAERLLGVSDDISAVRLARLAGLRRQGLGQLIAIGSRGHPQKGKSGVGWPPGLPRRRLSTDEIILVELFLVEGPFCL